MHVFNGGLGCSDCATSRCGGGCADDTPGDVMTMQSAVAGSPSKFPWLVLGIGILLGAIAASDKPRAERRA